MKRFEQLVLEDMEKNNYSSGVYISVDVHHDNDTLQFIQDSVRDLFDVPMDLNGLHTTIIYSKKPAPSLNISLLKINSNKFFDAYVKELTVWTDNNNNKFFGILLDSPELQKEYDRLMKFGFVSDYDSYMPHITLQYGTKIDITDHETKEKLDSLNSELQNNPSRVLQLTNESIEPLNNDWSQ